MGPSKMSYSIVAPEWAMSDGDIHCTVVYSYIGTKDTNASSYLVVAVNHVVSS